MQNRSFLIKALCWGAALLILAGLAIGLDGVAKQAAKEDAILRKAEQTGGAGGFFCYTYDDRGEPLFAHWSEQDEQWYLFVPSTQKIADLKLCYLSDISRVSSGNLDAEKKQVQGAFAADKDLVLLTDSEGRVHRVTLRKSTLPCVYIDLGSTTLEQIHGNRETLFGAGSISITDPEGVWDLTVHQNLQIRGRGNSSWREFEKKGYQIEFKQNTSVMGMAAAKRWVLLSGSGDDSLMRTKLVSEAVQTMGMDFAASFRYVDLWMGGEYLGLYLLGEKVELDPARLNLTHAMGALFEHDEAFYEEEAMWFLCQAMNRHFTLKQTVGQEDEILYLSMDAFEEKVDQLIRYLYTAPSEQVTLEDLSRLIDVDSFALYYLINEYALNRESFATSFYWYMDGPEDVLHLGPVWDFDTCMGNDLQDNTASFGHEHVMFRYLLAIPAFSQRVEQLYEAHRSALERMTLRMNELREIIRNSADMNYLRWDILGAFNPKTGSTFTGSYDEALEELGAWLEGRPEGFRIVSESMITSTVSEDCRTLTLRFLDETRQENILFAVRIGTGEEEVKKWYQPQLGEDGAWYAQVDLGYFNRAGIYYFDAYTEDREQIASGRNYVKDAVRVSVAETGAAVPVYRMRSSDGRYLYTANEGEKESLMTQGWSDEGIVCYTPAYWGVPVYRIYNPVAQVYHYSMSRSEREMLVSVGWQDQGFCWNSDSDEVPVYRMWNEETWHYYTVSEEECAALMEQGYEPEGVGWYGIDPQDE